MYNAVLHHLGLFYNPGIKMTQHAPIEINVHEQDGVRIFDLHGRLTIGDSSDQLTNALTSVLQEGARKVIIDLNGVPQIDSSGISTLVRMSVSLGREGGILHLVCKPGRVLDALTVTRLVEAIPTFESKVLALKGFA
jgi:anti-anti-sigma factor